MRFILTPFLLFLYFTNFAVQNTNGVERFNKNNKQLCVQAFLNKDRLKPDSYLAKNTQGVITVSKDRRGDDNPAPVKIADAEWQKIIEAFQKIHLEELPNLEAPSKKRFYDGAAIANLKITYKDKIYESASFDHGNAPSEIKKLVDKINALVKEKE